MQSNMKKNQRVNLYSVDNDINKIINSLANKKMFNRLLDVLENIGTFDRKVEIFKDESNLDDEKIKVWCFDQNNNIFVFYLFSNAKQDFFKISEERDDGVSVYYDFSLSKNYPLSSNNISFIKCEHIYNFKHGRLITTSENDYNLFIQNDNIISIHVDPLDQKLDVDMLLKGLNSCETINLKNYIEIVNSIITFHHLNINYIKVSVVSKFQVVNEFKINFEPVHKETINL